MPKPDWQVAFETWVDYNGLDPAEKDRGSVSRSAFHSAWVLRGDRDKATRHKRKEATAARRE